MSNNVLIENLSEPLDGTKSARLEIDTHFANLTIDRLTGGEPVLASGTLEYLEKEGLPTRTLDSSGGHANLVLKGGGRPKSLFRMPWDSCNAAIEWQLHLNPMVPSDINAHSGGGNVKVDLTGMAVTHVSADSGGGNLELVLPDNAANINASARTGAGNVSVEIGRGLTGANTVNAGSGAGNVEVHVPGGIAVKVHASTGMGKAIVDSQFTKIDRNTYQSPDYDNAANKVEITAQSGAGNVTVDAR